VNGRRASQPILLELIVMFKAKHDLQYMPFVSKPRTHMPVCGAPGSLAVLTLFS
jgi:hypothetical protein